MAQRYNYRWQDKSEEVIIRVAAGDPEHLDGAHVFTQIASDTVTKIAVTCEDGDSDDELIQRVFNKDSSAWSIIYQRYRDTVYRICYKRLRNPQDAEDVTQEVFLRAWRKIDQLQDSKAFVGWLAVIAKRLSINNAVRGHHKFEHACEGVGDMAKTDSTTDSFIQQEEDASRIHAIRDHMADLPPYLSDVLELRLEGYGLKEIAVLSNAPLGTIKRRLHTARVLLRRAVGVPENDALTAS